MNLVAEWVITLVVLFFVVRWARTRWALRSFRRNVAPLITPGGVLMAGAVVGHFDEARTQLRRLMAPKETELVEAPVYYHLKNEAHAGFMMVTDKQVLWFVRLVRGDRSDVTVGNFSLDSFAQGQVNRSPSGPAWKGELLTLVVHVPGDAVVVSEWDEGSTRRERHPPGRSQPFLFSQPRETYEPRLAEVLFSRVTEARRRSGLPPFVSNSNR